MTVPVAVDMPTPVINIQLPAETPLMCDIRKASELTGLSATTLTALQKRYKDFPVRRIGKSVRYLMPDLYAWFRDFGGDIETE